jgi:hypothetical protein
MFFISSLKCLYYFLQLLSSIALCCKLFCRLLMKYLHITCCKYNFFFHLFSHAELSLWLQVNKKNDWAVSLSGNAIDLYSEGAWFYSQSGHRPS